MLSSFVLHPSRMRCCFKEDFMDRVLVLYDLTGQVWNIVYGADEHNVPQGIPSVWCDLPAGAQIERVDPVTKEVHLLYADDTDLGQIQREVREVTNAFNDYANRISGLEEFVVAKDSDITALQIGLTEVYEMLIGEGES